MVVALKNFMRTHQFIFFVCNLRKEKYPLFLFHSLTLSLSISSFGLHHSNWSTLFLCVLFSLKLTHKMAEYGSLASVLLTRPNGLSFLSFLLFQFQRVQGMACWLWKLEEASSFNELWPKHVGWTHMVLAPNKKWFRILSISVWNGECPVHGQDHFENYQGSKTCHVIT